MVVIIACTDDGKSYIEDVAAHVKDVKVHTDNLTSHIEVEISNTSPVTIYREVVTVHI